MDLKVNAGMPGRVFSIFDNPNTFAQVLLLLLPLVLALFLTAKHWQWKAICAGIFCVGGMAMAMTYSRASWVGLAVAMAVFVFLWKPKLIPAFILPVSQANASGLFSQNFAQFPQIHFCSP